MIEISKHSSLNSLRERVSENELIDFLHQHLDQFRDSQSAIRRALDYAFSTDRGKGGFIALAWWDGKLAGAVVMNRTGMREYVPGWLLVYIAVNGELRGQGIGSRLLREIQTSCGGDIALHVEYENPAKRLYERMGFTSKYAEMRFTGS